ncbi:glycerophosphoryl diester phosphodiesterase membrane domain-containing protein [Natrialbaceae archaeon A-gly3]
MDVTVGRKNTVNTILEAFEWLKRNPILILAFFVVGLVEGLGEEFLLFSLLGLILVVFIDGIAHRFAYAEAAGEETTISAEAGPVLARLLSLLGAFVVYIVAVVIGLIFLIIPGIYLGLRLALAFPAIVIDDQRALEGLSTSWDVAHGNLLKLLGISVLAIVAAFSIIIATSVFAVALDSVVVLAIISAIVTAILSPIVELSYARVYLENRGGERAQSAGVDRRQDDERHQPGTREHGTGDSRDDSWDDDPWDDDSDWDDPWNDDSNRDDERDRSNW